MTLSPDSGPRGYGMCMNTKVINTKTGLQNLLCGYEDGSLVLWDLKLNKVRSRHKLHDDAVMCFDYCESTQKGISGSVDDKLQIWKIEEAGNICPVKQVTVTNKGINCIKIRGDSKLFMTGGWDSRIRLFGMKKCNPLAVLCFHTASVQTVTFSKDKTIAAGSKDSLISIWSIYK